MGRSKQILGIFMFLVALTLMGCRDELYKGEEEANTIRFKCDSIATRASGYETDGTNAILSMGVYAAATAGDWDGTANCGFMQNVNVSRTDANSPWKYNNEKRWPGSGKVSFFAYAPHGAPGFTLPTSTVGAPAFKFEVQPEQKDQIDFLLATPQKNQTKSSSPDGYTTMTLRHALTRVFFGAKTKDQVDETVVVTKIELTGIHNAGTTTMDGGNRVWTPESAKATYALTSANGGLKTTQDIDHTDYKTITPDDGALFLLPQTIPTDATIKVTYTLNGVAEPVVEYPLSDILAQWQAGESIRFLINIDAGKPFNLEFGYDFTSWSTALNTDVPIAEDPYLYVSELNVKAYDGATTRVYFYTNQTDVKIDPQARLGSAEGTAIKTKHHFYNLVKDPHTGDPYEDWDVVRIEEDYGGPINVKYDAGTKKGYIDVVNRIFKGSTTGDKTPIVIRLRAGKLDKYITITPHITPYVASTTLDINSLSTPRYLSIFHKRAEKGERVLSWYEPENATWEIVIDTNVGDGKDIVIDRLPSVDHHTNLLYTSTPRDPEGGTVDAGWGTTLKGRGRVHFRLGWKTTSTSLNRNRYAIVRFKLSTVGQGTKTEIIRCRQGEEPDFIVDNSQEAFAVYNLMGDGQFTQYPSQGGFISQWGRPRMWPLVGDGTPAGYPDKETSTDLDPDVAICPEGYGYPTKAIVGNYFQNSWGIASTTISSPSICADGFYDRRAAISNRVDPSSINIAARGVVIYQNNTANCRSLFLPTPGYRNETGMLGGLNISVEGTMQGIIGGYWSGDEMPDKNRAYGFHATGSGGVFTITKDIIPPKGMRPPNPVDGYDKRNSFMVRCVKVKNAIKLIFDANGGENAPRAATVAPNGTVYVTRRIPSNYWRPGHFFVGWAKTKTETTPTIFPSNNYTVGATSETLYAVWSKNLKLNFEHTMLPTDQGLYTTLTSYNSCIIGNNGQKVLASDLTDWVEVGKKEKAFYHLEFDAEIQEAKTWVDAYTACKTKLPVGTWRLPRLMELLLFSQKSVIPSWAQADLFGGVSSPLWCGTEQDNDKAYEVMYYNSKAEAKPKTDTHKYRCVKEY